MVGWRRKNLYRFPGHSQDLLLLLDVMVIMEKYSVINGKDQRLIVAVSFMFIHFPA